MPQIITAAQRLRRLVVIKTGGKDDIWLTFLGTTLNPREEATNPIGITHHPSSKPLLPSKRKMDGGAPMVYLKIQTETFKAKSNQAIRTRNISLR